MASLGPADACGTCRDFQRTGRWYSRAVLVINLDGWHRRSDRDMDLSPAGRTRCGSAPSVDPSHEYGFLPHWHVISIVIDLLRSGKS